MEGYKVKVCLFVKVHLAYNKNPNWPEAISWLFNKRGSNLVPRSHSGRGRSGYEISVAEDLNSGQPRTNPESGQNETRTRDRRITSLTR